MESKPMNQDVPTFAIPVGLNYKLGIADALPSSHNISQFLASNASTFTPSNKTVRINVSSGAFLDVKNAVEQWLPYIIINEVEVLTDDGNASKIYVQIKYSITIESFKENTVLVAFDSIT